MFRQNTKALAGGGMITVTAVRVSPDMSFAKVYLSLFGVDDKKITLKGIQEKGWEIRKNLGTQIRHQMRSIPELSFYIDDSLDKAARIDELLK